jgi:hypothetical protein
MKHVHTHLVRARGSTLNSVTPSFPALIIVDMQLFVPPSFYDKSEPHFVNNFLPEEMKGKAAPLPMSTRPFTISFCKDEQQSEHRASDRMTAKPEGRIAFPVAMAALMTMATTCSERLRNTHPMHKDACLDFPLQQGRRLSQLDLQPVTHEHTKITRDKIRAAT